MAWRERSGIALAGQTLQLCAMESMRHSASMSAEPSGVPSSK
jgi:hypothetical protein